MTGQKPRQIAARVLLEWSRRRDYIENLLDAELSRAGLSGPDRGLTHELVLGVVRWQATLDWIIAQKTDGRPQKPVLQVLLRLGLYQKFWLERIPDYAIADTSVELARLLGAAPQAGFVNAVLRRCFREHEAIAQQLHDARQQQPALGFSHPQWLCDRWRARWGDTSLHALLAWNNSPPPTYARVNTLKTDAARLAEQWTGENVAFTPRQWPWTGEHLMFELTSHPPLASLPSFQQGLFYIQDPSTVFAVHELQAQPGDRVNDTCAAPGGKTTLLAQFMQNRGYIEAQDRELDRRRMIWENCQRLGVTCVRLAEPSAPAADPNTPPALFDRVLVDAPCSNTGVMRRRAELRWRIRPEEIERLSQLQLDLLTRAATQLQPGGTLVYSTCSLEPEENSGVVQRFLAAHPHFELKRERELLPFAEKVDGAYVARLVRRPGTN